eukprot:2959283-Pleurochrysis_carterae.AAC.1
MEDWRLLSCHLHAGELKRHCTLPSETRVADEPRETRIADEPPSPTSSLTPLTLDDAATQEVETACSLLSDRALSNRPKRLLLPMPLYAALPPAAQLRALEPAPKGARKARNARSTRAPPTMLAPHPDPSCRHLPLVHLVASLAAFPAMRSVFRLCRISVRSVQFSVRAYAHA